MKGIFISFEGPDGGGKTTQITKTAAKLREMGRDVVVTREPGGTDLGESIREILLDPGQKDVSDRAEVLLYAASRAQHVFQVIGPAIKAGKVVLCDRFVDSSIAYQGFGRGLDLDFISSVNLQATEGTVPQLTLLLDIPAEQGLVRAKGTGRPDRMEKEAIKFHREVRQGYLWLKEQHPHRFRLIDATNAPEQVFNKVWAEVAKVLGGFNHEVSSGGGAG
ncbi:dTMP kinase [Metallumcola ferriviriculae]|uniref:Thymidylate kinase n=1 Tax=Metallumcola ferriviriculae TaxID=3039180 RepID=A0AAU0UHX4_9FIRM|nr:dTMP kinase [Desulfitibacteraceae bacterium MK1]